MKFLFIAIAVILALILAMGGLSSLSGSLSDVIAMTSTAAVTTEGMIDSPDASASDVIFYPYQAGRIPNLSTYSVCYYMPGAGYYSDHEGVSFIWGVTQNSSTDEAMLAFQISGLTIGNEYLLQFSSWDNSLAYYLCYRFASEGWFTPIDMDSYVEYFTLRFEATTPSITLGLVKLSNISDLSEEDYASLLQSKLSVLKETLFFELLEVTS